MKRIGLLCLALVLALGSLGVSGALWSDDLYIDGWIQTGNIGAEWSLGDCSDSETPEKDVSWVEAEIIGDTLYVNIYNAYPSITYTVAWDIHCTGSVPIHFADPVIDLSDMPSGATFTFTDMGGYVIDWSLVQLHFCEVMWGLLTVHLDNTAEENAFYSFAIDLEYGQYNEFP